MEFSAKVFLYTAIIVLGIRMCYEWFTRKPKKPTITTLPPEPTDWVTIDTDKGHWWDG
jgi:hypothetical protein